MSLRFQDTDLWSLNTIFIIIFAMRIQFIGLQNTIVHSKASKNYRKLPKNSFYLIKYLLFQIFSRKSFKKLKKIYLNTCFFMFWHISTHWYTLIYTYLSVGPNSAKKRDHPCQLSFYLNLDRKRGGACRSKLR